MYRLTVNATKGPRHTTAATYAELAALTFQLACTWTVTLVANPTADRPYYIPASKVIYRKIAQATRHYTQRHKAGQIKQLSGPDGTWARMVARARIAWAFGDENPMIPDAIFALAYANYAIAWGEYHNPTQRHPATNRPVCMDRVRGLVVDRWAREVNRILGRTVATWPGLFNAPTFVRPSDDI